MTHVRLGGWSAGISGGLQERQGRRSLEPLGGHDAHTTRPVQPGLLATPWGSCYTIHRTI